MKRKVINVSNEFENFKEEDKINKSKVLDILKNCQNMCIEKIIE